MRIDALTPQADEFLRGTRLATIVEHGDAFPHAVPLWFRWTGDHVEFFTRPQRPKVARLRSDPRISVLVSAEVAEPVYWVRIDGRAELDDDADALVVELCDRYLTPGRPDHDALRHDLISMSGDAIRVRVHPERFFHFAG